MRKNYVRIAEIKEQMRSMLDKAEAEKRILNETEQKEFDSLKNEKELLQMREERRGLDNEPNYLGGSLGFRQHLRRRVETRSCRFADPRLQILHEGCEIRR